MSLPPYSHKVTWKEYQIDTPTFELSPVEKPDMSPYLVHMTGKDAIASILRGEGSESPIAPGTGFLKAVAPDYEGIKVPDIFRCPVVCFTESPTFALDFFRYRSFRRWQDDQRFGLGFNKASLAERGIRPVVYMDAVLRAHLRSIHGLCHAADWEISGDLRVNSGLRDLIEGLVPLVFPLLEDHSAQGFMWEREWRAPFREGLLFSHDDIEIICCPSDEEREIREQLGPVAEGVRFVRTWLEYDDVTAFLQHREELRQPRTKPATAEPTRRYLRELDQQRVLHEVAIHNLEGYVALSDQIASRAALAKQELAGLKQRKAEIEEELVQLQKRRELQEAAKKKIKKNEPPPRDQG